MKKKIIPLLAATLLALTIGVSGCASTDGSGSSSSSSSSSSSQSAGPVDPGGGGFVNPGDSLGGGGTGEIADPIGDDDATVISSEISQRCLAAKEDVDDQDATTLSPSDSVTTISEDGSYLLEGNYGGISVKKGLTVHLFLKNATVSNTSGVAIESGKGCTVTITAEDGTKNTVTNAGDDVNAIHIKGSLTINGKGAIAITSSSKSGVKASEKLIVVDSTLTVNCANHGVTAREIEAQDATITVLSAQKDGMNAECDDDVTSYTNESGYVTLKNVNYTCSVMGDGIQADSYMTIEGGSYDITTTGEFVNYTTENMTEYDLVSDDFRYQKSGNTYYKVASDTRLSSNLYALKQSCKGLKVGEIAYEDESGNEVDVTEGDYTITLNGGKYKINSSDDAIHCNVGSLFVKDGTFDITTLDDGLTSDNLTRIDGGDITVNSCYEGVEGAYVEITGGSVDVTSKDDGVNAASDLSSVTEHIIISGGEVTVNSTGDGIDSNGSILISGGTTVVHGPTSGGDAALDSEKGIVVTGGTLFASSTLGMVETPSSNSTQYVVSFATQSSMTSGTIMSVVDSDKESLIEVTLQKNAQSFIFSSPEFTKNSSYTLYGGDTALTTFTITSVITSIGSSTQPGSPNTPWNRQPNFR